MLILRKVLASEDHVAHAAIFGWLYKIAEQGERYIKQMLSLILNHTTNISLHILFKQKKNSELSCLPVAQ